MDVSGYSFDELDEFSRILDVALTEATAQNLDIPIPLMAKRLFDAAGHGERDPLRLKAAILRHC